VQHVAKQARIHDDIAGLPQGYDTWIGERGMRLSGGQRQRLAVARALLRDCPIMVLDEPTSQLDPLTEAALLGSLLDSLAGRSVLLMTHRLVGMEQMDEILVLKDGRVTESGTCRELVDAHGLYRRLWDLQNGAQLAEHAIAGEQGGALG
jgi:ATP-binding cassette subfamily C protein CydC